MNSKSQTIDPKSNDQCTAVIDQSTPLRTFDV
jgi:hypothetical protein